MADTAQLPPGYPARWEADVVLADGGTIHVRPVRPDDRTAIAELHDRLSDETVYLRFFSPIPHLPNALLERFTVVDYVDRLALVAELGDQIVAVARYDRLPGREEAEVAFVVEDAHQGRGVGMLLLEHLAGAAKEAGIRRFVAETLPGNNRMLGVFYDAGFGAERRFDSGVVRVSFAIEPTEESVRAMHERERRASARSVARLLAPTTVAVIGAGRRPGSLGHAVFRHLLACGFAGTVHPVHHEAAHVGGVKAYRTVTDVPDPVDLAVVVVPAAQVETVVEQCARKRVGGLVIISAGFAETGADGAALERRIVLTAHRHGMRVIGPNCMGVANTSPGVRLNATLAPTVPGPGPAGLMAQAGALGIAILEEASRRGLGLSTFVSAGNKADISGNDMLHYWEEDPATRVILLYLESFGNPRTFSRLARRISRRKPIVVVKAGRTAAGSRAVSAHTGALASPEGPVDALFRQTGVIRVDSLEQLLDVAQALALQPLPAGRRVAIVGNAGGPGVLAADACEGVGLDVPELAPATVEALSELAVGTATNPVNLDASAPPGHYEAALGAVLADPGVDAALALFVPPFLVETAGSAEEERVRDVAAAIARAGAQHGRPRPKPVLANFLAIRGNPDALRGPDGRGIPSYGFPEAAALALSHMASLAEWRARPEGTLPEVAGVDRMAAASVVAAALNEHPEGTGLAGEPARALLAAYGVALAPDGDAGAADAPGVAAGARGAPPLMVAVDHHPSFGPVITVSVAGGPGDAERRASRVLPLTDVDAAELISSPPVCDVVTRDAASAPGGLEELMTRLARLSEDVAELVAARLTVAPGPPAIVTDALLRVAPAEPRPELALRRLR